VAALVAVLVFFFATKVIKRFTKKNSVYYSIICGLVAFIIVLLFGFFLLENNSGEIDLKYFPPKYINGKVLDGEFSK
tara:strand:- start:51 stop:281 length:231 start_codon:yes stop_codon:yes gene_type:complete